MREIIAIDGVECVKVTLEVTDATCGKCVFIERSQSDVPCHECLYEPGSTDLYRYEALTLRDHIKNCLEKPIESSKI